MIKSIEKCKTKDELISTRRLALSGYTNIVNVFDRNNNLIPFDRFTDNRTRPCKEQHFERIYLFLREALFL